MSGVRSQETNGPSDACGDSAAIQSPASQRAAGTGLRRVEVRLRVLIACEFSAVVRDAFLEAA